MTRSRPRSASSTTRPVIRWNKGAFTGPNPPLKPKQVWSITSKLQQVVQTEQGNNPAASLPS